MLTLDPALQPTTYYTPIFNWGLHPSQGTGTLLFYEYPFLNDKLLSYRDDLLRNITTHSIGELVLEYDDLDNGKWIFQQQQRKRGLSKRFQSQGIPVWIDLTIRPDSENLMLMGVPHGWRSYTIHKPLAKDLIRIASLAEDRAEGEIMLICYGGSFVVQDLCKLRGWHYEPEYQKPQQFLPSTQNPLRPTPLPLKAANGATQLITIFR